jgi:two-component system sensor histidine kinase RegB
MGRAGKSDLHLMRAPLGTVLKEAAEPHANRGKQIIFDLHAAADAPRSQPTVQRKPEVIHGIRNLIQNAVDFAKSTVWIDAEWGHDTLTIRVVDDGNGYSSDILGRIGDPFVRQRSPAHKQEPRPGYEGMGLGLFIAKTLLERSGAELSFANGHDLASTTTDRPARSGAIVELIWALPDIVALDQGVLGENTPMDG